MLFLVVVSMLTASALLAAPLTELASRHLHTARLARHAPLVARELNFVAALEVKTSPFAATSPLIGQWFASEAAIKILMSQAESSRRLAGGIGDTRQQWLVTTPCEKWARAIEHP